MQIPRLTPCPMFCALKRRLLDHPEISSNRHAALPIPTCGIGQGVPSS